MSKLPDIAVTVLSAHLWGASVVDACTDVLPDRAVPLLLTGAAMTGVIASLLWVARGTRINNGSLGLLVRTIASVTQPADAHAELRLVQEMGAEVSPVVPVRLLR